MKDEPPKWDSSLLDNIWNLSCWVNEEIWAALDTGSSRFRIFQMRCKTPTGGDTNWWLVTGTLFMQLELLHDFFGNFSTQGERYYFHVEGSRNNGCEMGMEWSGGDNLTYTPKSHLARGVRWMQGWNGYARWEWSYEVGVVMRGGHEVGMCNKVEIRCIFLFSLHWPNTI